MGIRIHAQVLGACLVGSLALGGCSASDGKDGEESLPEHAQAMPTAEMLDLDTEGDGSSSTRTAALALTGVRADGSATGQASAGLEGRPSEIRAHIQEIRADVRGLLKRTHDAAAELFSTVEPTDVNESCKRWEASKAGVTWQLTSCQEDAAAKRYAFVLRGQKAGEEARVLVAGHGAVSPKVDGKRRGHGSLGYDLDALAALTGAQTTGKLAIGYRVVGRGRALDLGFRNVSGADLSQPYNALYRFKQGPSGGTFRYLTVRDIFTAGQGGTLAKGTDGKDDLLRVKAAWSRLGAARAAIAVCGDTVKGVTGALCIGGRQCWKADGAVSFEDWSGKAKLDRCEVVAGAGDDMEPPTEAEVTVNPGAGLAVDLPGGGASVDAPVVDEPVADGDE